MKAKPKTRGRLAILSHIAAFSLARQHGGRAFGGLLEHCFQIDTLCPSAPPIGALVAPTSLPLPSKWYLSWLVDVGSYPNGARKYLLESIEDGELCWWDNIGLQALPFVTVRDYPHWRWTDEQFAFNRRWLRACNRHRAPYVYKPMWATFGEDRAVELGVRVSHSLENERLTRAFADYRAVRVRDMLAFFDEAEVALGRRGRPAPTAD